MAVVISEWSKHNHQTLVLLVAEVKCVAWRYVTSGVDVAKKVGNGCLSWRRKLVAYHTIDFSNLRQISQHLPVIMQRKSVNAVVRTSICALACNPG